MDVNRSVIILKPGPRFVAWHREWNARQRLTSEPYERAYLVPRTIASTEELQAYLNASAAIIFESVLQGYAPRSRWPWPPDVTEFSEWFNVTWVASLQDMCADSVLKEASMGAFINEA